MDHQAEDRAHRIGRKKEVWAFVLVSVGSIDEVILECAKQKMAIDAKVIQARLFNTTSTAEDRREMREEVMRRGSSSLGADVPSEREINRPAARSERIFEEMDEEKKKKEGYRSRFMEDHEVPEWVYLIPDDKRDKAKSCEQSNTSVLGKRRRNKVDYGDTLSETQWIKAVENGQDKRRLQLRLPLREKDEKILKAMNGIVIVVEQREKVMKMWLWQMKIALVKLPRDIDMIMQELPLP